MFDAWPHVAVHPRTAGRLRFAADPRADKIDFRTGVFKNDAGECAIFPCVKEAERRILEEEASKDYLDLDGHPGFRETLARILLGGDPGSGDRHVETVHTPGGNAACWLAARLLATQAPDTRLWVSDPTWGNHLSTFREAGARVDRYPWPVSDGSSLDVGAVTAALAAIPMGHAVLLQGCCHNPTGIDPTLEQWEAIARVLRERRLLPLVDVAFLGYGDGIEEDLAGLRLLARTLPGLIVTTSWSKTFCLYRERVGAFTVIARDREVAARVFHHATWKVRASWSNPPSHGAAIVDTIARDAELRAAWLAELAAIRERIGRMRRRLVDGLRKAGVALDLGHVLQERSLFTTLGLPDAAVQSLERDRGIHVGPGGSLNVVAATEPELDRFCAAVASVLA